MSDAIYYMLKDMSTSTGIPRTIIEVAGYTLIYGAMVLGAISHEWQRQEVLRQRESKLQDKTSN